MASFKSDTLKGCKQTNAECANSLEEIVLAYKLMHPKTSRHVQLMPESGQISLPSACQQADQREQIATSANSGS